MRQIISQSPLDQYRSQIEQWIESGLNNPSIVVELSKIGVSTSEGSIRRARRRWNISPNSDNHVQPFLKVDEDTARIVSDIHEDSKDIDELIRGYGLNPDEWRLDKPKFLVKHVNGKLTQQADVILKRIKPFDLVVPARTPMENPPPKVRVKKKPTDAPRLAVFVGDQQAPYHNVHLHDMFCYWLEEHQPDMGISMGDGADLETLSTHPSDMDNDNPVQAGIDQFHYILKDYRFAHTSTNWKVLEGNHDYRLRRYLMDKAPELYNIRRAVGESMIPEEPLLRMSHLLRLDELDIEMASPEIGSWKHGQTTISPYLAARHSDSSRPRSGDSVKSMLDKIDYSIVVGHNHRQAIVHKTRGDININAIPVIGVETGCMCRIEDGLGYTPGPDWMNGFATAWVWPDGKFKVDLGTYIDGVLYYGDKRYE